MNEFNVTDPTTGQTLTLRGESPPTEQELEQIFSSMPSLDADPNAVAGFAGQQRPDRTIPEKIGRGLGLGARALAETPGLTVAGVSDLLSQAINFGLDTAGVDARLPENRAAVVQEGFNRMGFPQPETRGEEVVQNINRAVVGSGFGIGAGRTLATAPNPVTAGVGATLEAGPAIQGAGAVSSSVSGDIAQEFGASPAVRQGAELVGGALGPAALVSSGRTVAGTARGAAGLKDTFTESGQRKIAGNVLEDQSISPSKVKQNLADEQVFGGSVSDQTTGSVAKDAGLLTLERTLRNTDTTGRFGQAVSQANIKRQRILEVIKPTTTKAQRDSITKNQRAAAFADAAPVTSDKIIGTIDGILGSPSGKRKVVRAAMTDFRKELDGVTDPRVLYEVRKDINQAISGKSRGQERSDFNLAKKQLITVRKVLDNEIERAAPGFKKYLEDYAKLSREIDQRGVIESIQKRSELAVSDPDSGTPVLSQAKFKNRVNAERDSGVLTDEQLTVLDAIAQDLDSGQATTATGIRPTGSDTVKNLTVAHVIGRAIGGNQNSAVFNTLAKPLRWMTQFSEDQIQELLVDAMLDPKLARKLLNEARPDQIRAASRSLREIAALSTAGSAPPQTQTDSQ